MKCIKRKSGAVSRVTDIIAHELVRRGDATYTPCGVYHKHEYRELRRKINSAFWDCECDQDYIHIKSETLHCDKCGADEDDMPDSHTKEVLYMLLDQARELDSMLFKLSIKSKRHLKMVSAFDIGEEGEIEC